MEKVSCFPNEGTPEVLAGPIVDGDIVRVGTAYFRYKATSNPQPVPRWDAYDFKMRFTAQERKDIRAAAKVNADVEDFVDLLDTAAMTGTLIHADNALVIAALTAMEGTIIASGRKAEILGE